jgi:hypothetical protein
LDHWQKSFEIHAAGQGLDATSITLVARGAILPDGADVGRWWCVIRAANGVSCFLFCLIGCCLLLVGMGFVAQGLLAIG